MSLEKALYVFAFPPMDVRQSHTFCFFILIVWCYVTWMNLDLQFTLPLWIKFGLKDLDFLGLGSGGWSICAAYSVICLFIYFAKSVSIF